MSTYFVLAFRDINYLFSLSFRALNRKYWKLSGEINFFDCIYLFLVTFINTLICSKSIHCNWPSTLLKYIMMKIKISEYMVKWQTLLLSDRFYLSNIQLTFNTLLGKMQHFTKLLSLKLTLIIFIKEPTLL